MGCGSSLPKSDARDDIVRWYHSGPESRAKVLQPSTADDSTTFTFNGAWSSNQHSDIAELQYLSRAVTVRHFFYRDDDAPLSVKAMKKRKSPDLAYAEFGKYATELEEFEVFRLRAPGHCFALLLQNLPSPQKLHTLTFTRAYFDNEVIDAIKKSGLVNVTSLTLCQIENTPVAGSLISGEDRRWDTLFAGLPNLTNANIGGVNIDGKGLRALIASGKLKRLNVSVCDCLKAEDLAMIPQQCPVLERLDVGNCDLDGRFFRNMVTHVMPKLENLNLGNSSVKMDTEAEQKRAEETIQAFVDMMAEYSDRMDMSVARDGHYEAAYKMMMERARAVLAVHAPELNA